MAEDGEVQTEIDIDPDAVQDAAQQMGDTIGAFLGAGNNGGERVTQDNRAGLVFLALVKKSDGELSGKDNEAGAAEADVMRKDGAEMALESWKADAERRLTLRARAQDADAPLPNEEQIKAEMIAEMKRQLTELNGGELSESANQQVDSLLNKDAGEFAEAILENAAAVRLAKDEHRLKVQAAKEAGEQAPGLGVTGILATMMSADEGGQASNLNNVPLGDVDITPEGQVNLQMENTFEAMADFTTMGNGAEKALAQIQGRTWGSFNEETMRYEGLSPIESFGLKDEANYSRELQAFISPEGLGSVRDEPYYDNWSLTPGGEAGPISMDRLFTQPLEDNGLVSFDTQEARDDWNTHMGGGLAKELSGEDLQARMESFALARDDIDMLTEQNAMTDAQIALQERAARMEERPAEEPDVDAAPESPSEPAAAEAEVSEPVVVAEDEQPDPVSATGATAYLPGESRVGPFMEAAPDDPAARLQSVPQFMADMRAQRQLDNVPAYSPLAQMDPNLPQPGMNMGPGQA